MKVVIVALALVAIAAAIPVEQATREIPQILRAENEQDPEKGYRYGFESSDGTARREEGTLEEKLDEENKPHPVIVVRGSYTYINDKGQPETVTYEADENGFRAYGDTIPKLNSRR